MFNSAHALWWTLALALLVLELLTGTFYLLMLGLGAAAGALAAHLGAPVMAQVVSAALVGGLASAAWYARQRRHAADYAPAAQDPNVNLDIGQVVHVAAWSAEGTARVPYRGTLWDVRLQAGAEARPGAHTVVAVQGNWLELRPQGEAPAL